MALTKAFAVGASNTASGTTLTTGTFDSTGYTHIVCFGKHEGAAGATQTFTDNKGSSGQTYYTEESHSVASLSGQMGMFPIASPGTGHTVTMTLSSARDYRGMVVWLVNATGGSLTLDVQSVAEGNSNAPDAGSLVTTAATVSFMGVGEYDAGTFTAGSGWTEDYDSNHFGQSRSDASGTLDPACSWTVTNNWVACSASFKESGGAGTNPKGPLSNPLAGPFGGPI